MSTEIRSELSEKNKYYINKHRYYELKHFCMQYYIWKAARDALYGAINSSDSVRVEKFKKYFGRNDIEEKVEIAIDLYSDKMQMIESAAYETDSILGEYILKGATKGLTYEKLNAIEQIPCCRDIYYKLYRKFFWILNKKRN